MRAFVTFSGVSANERPEGTRIFSYRASDLADGILCAIIPGNLRATVDVLPGPARIAERAQSRPIFAERDEEVVSISLANLPFADEMTAGWPRNADQPGGDGAGKLQALDIAEVEALAVTVFKDNHEIVGLASIVRTS